jgi:hypothetical protein
MYKDDVGNRVNWRSATTSIYYARIMVSGSQKMTTDNIANEYFT